LLCASLAINCQATINVVPSGQKLFLSPVHIFEATSTLKVEGEDDDEYENDSNGDYAA